MNKRIHSLDTLKGLALIFVFYIHVRWFYVGGGSFKEIANFILMSFSRLAVPAFFLTSGYLMKMNLEKKSNSWQYCRKYLRKIGVYYVFGSVILLGLTLIAFSIDNYLGLEIVSSLELKILGPTPLFDLIYTGKAAGEHLWFLLALFYSVALIYLAHVYNMFEKLFGVALALHLVAILSRTYMVYNHLPIPQDDTLFFGLAFTAAGFYIKKKNVEEWRSAGFFLKAAILANLLHLLERALITVSFENYTPYFSGNYSLLTAPAAIMVFLYFLRKKNLGVNSSINSYGKKTLWIYLLHPIALAMPIGLGIILNQKVGSFPVENIFWSIGVTLLAYFGLSKIVIRSPLKKLMENFREPSRG